MHLGFLQNRMDELPEPAGPLILSMIPWAFLVWGIVWGSFWCLDRHPDAA